MGNSTVRLPALLTLALFATLSNADTIIYGSQGGSGSHLFSINVTTQTVNDIGAIGFDRVGGIRFNNSGTLYGVAGGSIGPATLMTVSTVTGVGTGIGVVGGIQGVDALAFDSAGTLFGGGWAGFGDLITIDPSTANMTGQVPLVGTGNAFTPGLAFNNSGVLYGSRGNSGGHTEDLVKINPVTGVETAIGVSDAVITDIWFAPDNTLYGASSTGLLYTINPNTGVKTLLMNTGISQLSGIAGVVPEPCTMAALSIAGLALLRRRKRA